RSLGGHEEGSRTALPMWMYFMADAMKGVPESPLKRPSDIITARISASSGLLALANTPDTMFELFRESDLANLGTDNSSIRPGGSGSPVADGVADGSQIF